MRPDDRPFICATWVRSYAEYAVPWGHERRQMLREHGRVVDMILARPDTETVVLATGDNESAIHAWACGNGNRMLHYVYVPPELRGNGFARQCIEVVTGGRHGELRVSHRWPRPRPQFEFDAYGIFPPRERRES